MKLKIVILILVILSSCLFGFGQQKSEAILMDEFSNVNEEELSARIDSFLQNVMSEPTALAYIVIYPAKGSTEGNFKRERKYELFIRSKVSLQKYDKSRINIVRSKSLDSIKIELWKVPIGAEKPFSIEEKWSEIKKDLTKPFVFGFTYEEEIFPNFIPEFYADYIKNNNLNGHVVVFDKSRKEGLRRANDWIKILTEEFKVPRKRLKAFWGKENTSVIKSVKGNSITEEFWLVPIK